MEKDFCQAAAGAQRVQAGPQASAQAGGTLNHAGSRLRQAAAGAMAERFLAQLTDAQPGVRALATTGVLTLLVGGQGAAWHQACPAIVPGTFAALSALQCVMHG